MQILIDIDDNLYTRLFDNGVDNYDDAVDIAKAIRKGMPLPKGHGRIIDTNEILKPFVEYGEKKCSQWKVGLSGLKVMLLKQTKAIIEAEEAENETDN